MMHFRPYVENYRRYNILFLVGFAIAFSIFFTIFYHVLGIFFEISLRYYAVGAGVLFGIYAVVWKRTRFKIKHINKTKRNVHLSALLEGFKGFSGIFTNIVNFLLLSIVYFVGIGPTSIVARIFGKRFLVLKKDRSRDSYWEDYNLGKKEKESYYRQF